MTLAALVAGAPLRIGSRNREAVLAVQRILHMPETGCYDDFAAQEVMDFQRLHKLDPVDGIVGPVTARTMDALATTGSKSTLVSVSVQARSDFGAAPVWFQWALHELGVHEVGDNAGPDIRRYIDDAHAGAEGDPWCAIFANAALEVNGIPGTRSASSQSFRSHPSFVSLDGPALGAVAVFWRKSRSSGLGHVGFYRGEAGDRVYVLGGNEADAVRIEAMPKAAGSFGLLGYFWPKSVPRPALGAIPIRSGQPLAQVKVI
jgi:uncharacterized protein (TIGR02594 family)